MRHVHLVLLSVPVAFVALLLACDGAGGGAPGRGRERPTAAQCERVVARSVELHADVAGVAESARARIISDFVAAGRDKVRECEWRLSVAHARCLGSAASVEAWGRCGE